MISASDPADFAGDGVVDFGYFVDFSTVFGSMDLADLDIYDLNGSGTVDFSDFVQFSNAFGQSVEVAARSRSSTAGGTS